MGSQRVGHNWATELNWILYSPQLWQPKMSPAAAKSLQSCPTLCDPIDSSPPGSAVPGILQARTREWGAIFFSNAWKWKVKSLSRVRLLATPWTAAYQASPSMGFSRQEYWSGVPLPSPKNVSRHCQLQRMRWTKIIPDWPVIWFLINIGLKEPTFQR